MISLSITAVLIGLIIVLSSCFVILIFSLLLVNTCYRKKSKSLKNHKRDGNKEELDRFIETDEEFDNDKREPSGQPLDDIFYFGDVDIQRQEAYRDELPIVKRDDHLQGHVAVTLTDTDSNTVGIMASKPSPSHSVNITVPDESVHHVNVNTANGAGSVLASSAPTSNSPSPIHGGMMSSADSVASDTSKERVGGTAGLLLAAQRFKHIHEQPDRFLSDNANLKSSFEHMESIKCFRGKIASIDGININTKDCPQEICLHVTLIPSKRFRMATKYKSISQHPNLDLTFTMGPVTADDLSNNILRIRLYGRKSKIKRSKCYGQCTIKLDQVVGNVGYLEINANLLAITSTSGSFVSSDSDR